MMNFEEEYFDLDQDTLENELVDFQVILQSMLYLSYHARAIACLDCYVS